MSGSDGARPWFRRLGVALGPPLIAFVVARLAFIAIVRAAHLDWLSGDSLIRFDAFLYLMISRDGYSLMHCIPASTGYPADQWCGTAGWFPLFPWLVAGLHKLGVPNELGAIGLAAAGHIATLVFAWNTFLEKRLSLRNVLALVLMAVGCGAVYQHAAFPISLALFLAVACLYFASEDRWWLSAAFGLLSAMTYSTTFLLASALGLWSLVTFRQLPLRERALRLVPTVAVMLGFGLVHIAIWRATGAWDAFFRVQAKYGHHLTNPFATLVTLVSPVRSGDLTEKSAPAYQSLLAICVVVLALWGVWRNRSSRNVLVALCVVIFWIFPLSMGKGVTFARAEALLLPAGLVVKDAPVPLVCGLLVALAVVERLIVLAFLHKTIV